LFTVWRFSPLNGIMSLGAGGRSITALAIKQWARQCGFELAGVTPAVPVPEARYYLDWVSSGMAAGMDYLSGDRAALRLDPRRLLPSARSIICAGKLYNGPEPYSTRFNHVEQAWISRYAWGEDYHRLVRAGLERLLDRLRSAVASPFEWKICVDTSPLLERAYARHAGLGWIAKNTCLINQSYGSWFFLGELLTSLDLPPDAPPPDRCGSCTRCIDACPTGAIVPAGFTSGPFWAVDSRLCISYFTIEHRGPIPSPMRAAFGNHLFGCDICQDVCPWNRRAPVTGEMAFYPHYFAPSLDEMAGISEQEFRDLFRTTPVARARYAGFLRNVAVAMGNSGLARFRAPLEKLAAHQNPLVAEHASWALGRIR
jgi:epoxyqueuosine reductase